MATLDFQLELGFPRKKFKDILAATLPPLSFRARALENFESKFELRFMLNRNVSV